MTEHTPTPWSWDGHDLWHRGTSYDDEADPHLFTGIVCSAALRGSPVLDANRALIETACNSHDALLAAMPTLPHPGGKLLKLVAHYKDGSKQTIDGEVVTAAIAAAEEKPESP